MLSVILKIHVYSNPAVLIYCSGPHMISGCDFTNHRSSTQLTKLQFFQFSLYIILTGRTRVLETMSQASKKKLSIGKKGTYNIQFEPSVSYTAKLTLRTFAWSLFRFSVSFVLWFNPDAVHLTQR